MFGRGWVGIVAYLESLVDGNPLTLIVVLLAAAVFVRFLILLLHGHGIPLAHRPVNRHPPLPSHGRPAA